MITIILLLLLIYKSVEFIYVFQIKEYRSDRLSSFIKEEGLIRTLYFNRLHWPAKSIRNVLVIFAIIFQLLLITPLLLTTDYYLHLVILPFAPFISFLLTFVAVQMTGILANYQRQNLINKARKMVYKSKVICIGVTGSYGKSTVKEFLYSILSTKHKVAKTDKNMNTDVGIALSVIKNLKPDTQYFITEFGAYRKGEIERETSILNPQYSILSGLGNQHLDLYGSLENLRDEETYILKILQKDHKAYINLDFPQSREVVQDVSARKVFYSTKVSAHISAHNIIQTTDGIRAEISYLDSTFTIKTLLLGEHNLLNLLPCIAIAKDLGMTTEGIIQAVSQIQQLPGKLSLHSSINGAQLLNDSYNTNENGFIAAIKTAANINAKEKYIVTKGIIELGVEKEASYKRILNELYLTNIKLITTDKTFQQLDTESRVMVLNDVSQIMSYLFKHLTKDSLLVIEGRFPKSFVLELSLPTVNHSSQVL